MASPTERADKWDEAMQGGLIAWAVAEMRALGFQVVTPEDIQAGWRVLTPEQAETVTTVILSIPSMPAAKGHRVAQHAVALLAGVPGKDSDE